MTSVLTSCAGTCVAESLITSGMALLLPSLVMEHTGCGIHLGWDRCMAGWDMSWWGGTERRLAKGTLKSVPDIVVVMGQD